MYSDTVAGWLIVLIIVALISVALYVVPKHDEDGWEVKNATCIQVFKEALDHTYAICNTNVECNAICAEQRNKQ